jgi:hypothetical protein
VTRVWTRSSALYRAAAPATNRTSPVPTYNARPVATYSIARKIPKLRRALPRSFVTTMTSIAAPQIASSGPTSFSRPRAIDSRFSRR